MKKLIICFLIAVMIVSGIYMFKDKYNDYTEEKKYKNINNSYITYGTNKKKNEKTNKKEKSEKTQTFNYDGLKKKNKDAVGWIYCKDVMSFPLVKCSDNNYYLTHNALRENVSFGAIFLDYRTTFKNKNCIIYGHNIKGRQMFGILLNYMDYSYAKSHNVFYVYDKSVRYKYKLISVRLTKDESSDYLIGFANDEQFGKWKRDITKTNYYKSSSVNSNKVITLSTCYSDDAKTKLVLHLEKIN